MSYPQKPQNLAVFIATAMGTLLMGALLMTSYLSGRTESANMPRSGSMVSLASGESQASMVPNQFPSPADQSRFTFMPALPEPNDVVTIRFSDMWGSSCIPEYQSHVVTGDLISINAAVVSTNPICLTIISPWSLDVTVGPLPSGNYRVEVYVAVGNGFPSLRDATLLTVGPSPALTTMTSVGGELTQSYLGHRTVLTVPSGALPTTTTFTISYQLPPVAPELLLTMDHFFDLASTQDVFNEPVSLTLYYSDTARGKIVAGTEDLYRLRGGLWVTDGITVTSRLPGSLSAQITEMSQFGLFGETFYVYLPLVYSFSTQDPFPGSSVLPQDER